MDSLLLQEKKNFKLNLFLFFTLVILCFVLVFISYPFWNYNLWHLANLNWILYINGKIPFHIDIIYHINHLCCIVFELDWGIYWFLVDKLSFSIWNDIIAGAWLSRCCPAMERCCRGGWGPWGWSCTPYCRSLKIWLIHPSLY